MSRNFISTTFIGRRAALARLAAILVATLIAGALPGIAAAQPLDAARASGMIGERFDGYAVARPSANADAKKLVGKVNAQRAAIYAKRARQQGISAEAVGKVYAKEILERAPKGTWFMQADGKWVRK